VTLTVTIILSKPPTPLLAYSTIQPRTYWSIIGGSDFIYRW